MMFKSFLIFLTQRYATSILLLFLFMLNNSNAMKIHEFCVDLFSKDTEGTEFQAYQELKRKPLEADVNYLAIPWYVASIERIKKELMGVHLNGGFTVLFGFEEDNYPIIKILKEVGIDCIFTPRASINCLSIDGIKVVSFPYYALNGVSPATTKDILYSFIGIRSSHPIRKKIFKLPHHPQAVIKQSCTWNSLQGRNEFKNILARSRFSLCPRGYAPNSIRFWESLQAGAIPLLLSDNALLPEGFDWDSCCIRVAESDIDKIQDIIKKITPKQEKKMREACLFAHKMFSGQNLISPIRRYYNCNL